MLKKSVGQQCPAQSAVLKGSSHIINNARPGQTVSLIQLYVHVSQAVYRKYAYTAHVGASMWLCAHVSEFSCVCVCVCVCVCTR